MRMIHKLAELTLADATIAKGVRATSQQSFFDRTRQVTATADESFGAFEQTFFRLSACRTFCGTHF